MELKSENVEKVFLDCLFKDGEDTKDYVKAEGITSNVGFHPGRLEIHKDDIKTMLEFLPNVYRKDSGGGTSFLNACNDQTGNQWTGFHQRMEQLFQLGIATGLAKWLMPHATWNMLPGGMPYVGLTF